jgi:hypothetical protein
MPEFQVYVKWELYSIEQGYYFNTQKIRFENKELNNISEISNSEYLPRSDIEFSRHSNS